MIPDGKTIPQDSAERLTALRELDLLASAVDPELDALTELAAVSCGAKLAALSILNENDFYRIAFSDGASRDLKGKGVRVAVPRASAFATRAMDANATLVIADASSDPDWKDYSHVTQAPFVRSYVGVPIGPAANLPIGVLSVVHTDPNAFGQKDIELLERIAGLVRLHLGTRLETIRAARAADRTAEERRRHLQFELIFEAIREGVNVYTPDGRVVEANQASCDLLGLTRDETFGRAITDPRWRTFRGDGEPFRVEDFPVTVTLKTGRSLENVPMGVELPSGERRWISINTVPMRRAETGEVDYAVVTFKDITAERQASDELKAEGARLAEALAAAERASQAKTDFLSVMSHELRTPMNAVLGCAALLKQSTLGSAQSRTLGVLEDASRQMLALLNDLFDLSSLDNGKVRLEREPTNLVRLIEDAAVIWAAEVRAKGLTLSVMIDPNLVAPRQVDPARVLQIIGNLMANAIKFTAEGHVQIQAWPARSRSGEDMVAIEVEDTGPGVPPEAMARIFSPFEQVDVSTKRRHGGLGVGLYVARRLAMAMGGDIELDSREGEGSRFTARLVAPLADAGLTAADAEPQVGAAHTVLCVDDNPRNLFVLGAILKSAGHEVIECASGAEALAVLARQKVDIVLLDMVMPEMDGLDVLAQLKAQPGPNAQTPVIACTANVLPDQIKAYAGAGTVGVISKPIDIAEVLKIVAAMAA